MNLTADKLVRLNQLLDNKKLDLPEIRRTVDRSGMNYKWLQKNILSRNAPLVCGELKELLAIS